MSFVATSLDARIYTADVHTGAKTWEQGMGGRFIPISRIRRLEIRSWEYCNNIYRPFMT